ncbi:ABC transporter substrate-binding protein [Enemella evansiae]|uniref:ABC transporter substrate-binding protein n=1 Tax=Enemella evansiae TaxID=2016499 RepID=A0A255FZE7_9ACTN|nr:ABC transporter substrate-binding protein [Enemella evansiae]OYO06301.1 ABC transporter substrate-binding protein [Enemella evansiae]OYO08671.1 ABC transporter substrate-binding protein [Enemella evansiae]OYO11408.1 ABC transporter substrate-binding protein [Enemella evansiae]PFG66363.1 multiple sugar transport system substrate-binding protein [Propionibacteriaceae bacterium ES.041]
MSFTRRIGRISVAGAAVGTMVLLAACGGGGSTSGGAGGQQTQANWDERGPIQFISGKDTSNAVPQIIEKWNAQNPDQQVSFIELSDSADEQRNMMIRNYQSKGVDQTVYDMDVVWTAEFAGNQYVEALPDGKFDTSKMLKPAVDASTYFNKLYAVPVTSDGGLLFYRKDWMDAAGITAAPKTLEEVKTVCKQIKEKVPEAKDADCYGGQFQKYEGLTVNVSEAINSAGGSIVKDNKVEVNSPEAQKGLQWISDSFKDGTIPQGAITWKEEESRQAFQDGKLMFLRNWPYVYSKFSATDGSSKVNDKFAVAPLPGVDGPGVSSLGGHSYAVAKFAKNKGTALDFIAFAAAEEQQKMRTSTSALAPTIESLYSDQELVGKYPYLTPLKESIAGAQPRPKVVKYGDVSKAIQDSSYAVLQGQKDPAAATAEMQTKLESLVK